MEGEQLASALRWGGGCLIGADLHEPSDLISLRRRERLEEEDSLEQLGGDVLLHGAQLRL